jgi:hypothetical protein
MASKESHKIAARAFVRGERESAEDCGVAYICIATTAGIFSKEAKAEMRKHLKPGEKLGSVGLGWPITSMELVEGRNEF